MVLGIPGRCYSAPMSSSSSQQWTNGADTWRGLILGDGRTANNKFTTTLPPNARPVHLSTPMSHGEPTRHLVNIKEGACFDV